MRALVVLLVLLAGCSSPDRDPSPGAERPEVALLQAWDSRRAEAYASGSVPALRRLYVAGSAAGRADARVLRGYVRRGLVVDDMTMQLLAVDVLSSETDRIRLRVTDRLTGARARGPGGVVALPRDQPSTHVVTMRQVGTRWVMESVLP